MNEQVTNVDNIKQFTDQCLDREFSYECLFENMLTEGINSVIRLKVGK